MSPIAFKVQVGALIATGGLSSRRRRLLGSDTNDRYIILPDLDKHNLTDLYWGAEAWEHIAMNLERGMSLKAAVDDTNTWLAPGGTPINTYHVYGKDQGAGVYVK